MGTSSNGFQIADPQVEYSRDGGEGRDARVRGLPARSTGATSCLYQRIVVPGHSGGVRDLLLRELLSLAARPDRGSEGLGVV